MSIAGHVSGAMLSRYSHAIATRQREADENGGRNPLASSGRRNR
jgi:hypothetical protein